jgi:hypothetical protein
VQARGLGRAATGGLLAMLVGSALSCSRSTERRSTSPTLDPSKWVTAGPADSFTWDTVGHETQQPRIPQRKYSTAGVEVQGDSMTVRIEDAGGHATSWNSWDGELVGGNLPGCTLDGVQVAGIAPGETGPSVEFKLASPAQGPYRIVVRARNRSQVWLTVRREESAALGHAIPEPHVWQDKAGVWHSVGNGIAVASEHLGFEKGSQLSWVAEWSSVGADSCWVHLRRDEPRPKSSTGRTP